MWRNRDGFKKKRQKDRVIKGSISHLVRPIQILSIKREARVMIRTK
jgi:hypothetical protein